MSRYYNPAKDGETVYRALITFRTVLPGGDVETRQEAYGPYTKKAPATTKINQSKRLYDNVLKQRRDRVDHIRDNIGKQSWYTKERLLEAEKALTQAEHTTYTYEVQTSEPDWKTV